jgi:thiol-disulfide isomerase/thioredoxin
MQLHSYFRSVLRPYVLGAFYLLILVSRPTSAQSLAPGSSLPSASIATLDGERVSLTSFKGKPLLINFWATWCAPCVAEMPELQALYEEHGDKLTVVAIAVEDQKSDVLALKKSLGLTFPLLLDPSADFSRRFNVDGFPESFIADKEGKLKFFIDGWRGPTLKIVGPRAWRSSSILKQIIN